MKVLKIGGIIKVKSYFQLYKKNWLILCILLMIVSPIQAHKDRIETPSEIIVQFSTGERIQMKYSYLKLVEIKIILIKNEITIPQQIIEKIGSIQTDSICLLWGDSNKSAENSKYFAIEFYIGNEFYFGEKKKIRLHFENKKLVKTEESIKISDNSWASYNF